MIGSALAGAAWWSWRTESQVNRLRLEVCAYQIDAVRIIRDLAAAGYPVPSLIQLPVPQDCP